MLHEKQKKFLQCLLHSPLLSAKELQKVHAACFDQDRVSDINEIRGLIQLLNNKLKIVQLSVKSRLCEDSNEEHFALLSLTETEASKHTAEFSPPELELFKHITKEIVASDNAVVSSIDCINYSSNIPKLGKTEAQKALDKFLSSKWLKEREGEVSFTARTLLELEPLLRKIDPDMTDCKICGVLAVKGVHCSNCHCKVHRYCLSKMSRGAAALKCPSCKNLWSSLDGTMSASQATPARPQSSSQASSSRASTSRQPLSQLQTPAQSDEPMPSTSNGRSRRRPKRLAESDSD